MTSALRGTIEEVGCDGEGCATCPYQVTEDDSYACENDNFWRNLRQAIYLWNLLEDERGERLLDLLKNEIQVHLVDDLIVMKREHIKKVLSLINGLDFALYKITDKNWHITPEYVEYTKDREPNLVTSWQNPDGIWVHTLANSLGEVKEAESFLKAALQLGREIEVG